MTVIAVVAGAAACTSAVVQSFVAPSTTIAPIAVATPVSTLIVTVGQLTATVPATKAATTPAGAVRTDGLAPVSAVFGLQQRVQTHRPSKLRTIYNGAYDVNLLFAQSDLTCYVTLSQWKDPWHVIKTTNEASTERLYSDFTKQARTTVDLELQRIRLEVQKEHSERQITVQQEKFRGLKTNLDIQRQQQARMQERQKVVRMEAEALNVERRAVRIRVDELQCQIHELEAQANAPFNSRPRCH